MVKKIYKYPVGFGSTVSLPLGSQVLAVAVQQGAIWLWALVNPSEKVTQARRFDVHGTGHPVADDPGDYIGTVFDGPFVWHVFEGRQ